MIMITVSTTMQALSSPCWPLQWNASSQWESEFFLLFHFNSLFFTVQASTMLYPVWHIIPKSGLRCQHLSATFGTPLSFLAHLLHIFLTHFYTFSHPFCIHLSCARPQMSISKCASLVGLATIVALAIFTNVSSLFEYTTKVQACPQRHHHHYCHHRHSHCYHWYQYVCSGPCGRRRRCSQWSSSCLQKWNLWGGAFTIYVQLQRNTCQNILIYIYIYISRQFGDICWWCPLIWGWTRFT